MTLTTYLASPHSTSNDDTRDIYTPSRLNGEARVLLERGFGSVWLEGEISNFSRPSSGHWYFSLKDDHAQLRSAMFRPRNISVNFTPKEGMQVLARGRVSVYEPRGDYQFIVDYLEEAGEGALRRQFEQLKQQLAAAGLFAAEHKRPLPTLPRRVGVITSPTGAAIRDILHILQRRFPAVPVLIYPVPVQGSGAAEQIAASITLASTRADCDVLILARGGGSLEDLWAFNEACVAQAIFACRIPLITGIGHEVDFTIADFVADVRAPTPSGAAELAVPDRFTWLRGVQLLQQRLCMEIQRALRTRQASLNWLAGRLNQLHPGFLLRQRTQRIDELEQRLLRALHTRIQQRRQQLHTHYAQLQRVSPKLRLTMARGRLQQQQIQLLHAMRLQQEKLRARLQLAIHTLETLSPLATLQRGYAIITDTAGKLLSQVDDIQPGTHITARLAQGRLHATINTVLKDEA